MKNGIIESIAAELNSANLLPEADVMSYGRGYGTASTYDLEANHLYKWRNGFTAATSCILREFTGTDGPNHQTVKQRVKLRQRILSRVTRLNKQLAVIANSDGAVAEALSVQRTRLLKWKKAIQGTAELESIPAVLFLESERDLLKNLK